ncbi:MAG: hypothetical protein RL205_29 [Actinomycetota bacterium]
MAGLGRLVAGGLQHLAEVDDLLLAAVVTLGTVEELHLIAHVDLELAAVVLLDGANSLEQAQGVVPAHVVAGGVGEDRGEGVGVVVVQVHRLLLVGHDCLSKMRVVVDAPSAIVGDRPSRLLGMGGSSTGTMLSPDPARRTIFCTGKEPTVRTMSYSQARQNLASAFDSVIDDCEELVVTRAGHEPVVIVSLADYESLKETAYLLSNPTNARRLFDAIENLEAGLGIERDLIE